MATLLTVSDISRTGLALAPAAPDVAGNLLPNTGKEFLALVNAGGVARTVSAAVVRQVDGITPAAKSISVPAGATRLWGPFPAADYNDASGQVLVTYDAITSLTVQAVRLYPV
jgi:hypothetical protein